MAIAWTTVPAPAPIRTLTLAVSDNGVVLVAFGDEPARVAAAAERLGEQVVDDPDRTAPAAEQLTDYLAGTRREFDVPLDWRLSSGTALRVLRTLHDTVPYGVTTTYGELATRSGLTGPAHTGGGARGVGAIMGGNPIPVIVACHRVLAADGPRRSALGGFGGGRAAKEWLLALEGVLTPALDFG